MRVGRALGWGTVAGGTAAMFGLVARGALVIDTGVGRRLRPLGPITLDIAAPPETVFDVIAEPYLRRTPRAMAAKLDVWERGSDMVLAAHRTRTRWFTTTTVETVRFERPTLVTFRLLRGPVPHVTETFALEPIETGTSFEYRGELGTDFWTIGSRWGNVVADKWELTVRASLESIQTEAERRNQHQ
jgi:Polyketide cyclase / dehydrase and lipid transport